MGKNIIHHEKTIDRAVFLNITIHNEAEMTQFAQQLAQTVQQGDCFTFSGELGAGKSFLARAMMRALGVQDQALPSPTFAIIQEYQANAGLRIAHMDWYRLNDEDDVEALGIQEFFQPPWLTLIEWSERAPALLPPQKKSIHIHLDYDNQQQRYIQLT